MSNFDPNQFLDAQITEESKRRPPVPAGMDLIGTITDVTVRGNIQGKKDPTKSYNFLDVKIEAQTTPALQAEGHPPTVTYVDGIILDVTDAGQLDMAPGKNLKLGRYRNALGMNVAGQPFSPRQMIGRTIRIKIKHEAFDGDMLDKVDSIAKA